MEIVELLFKTVLLRPYVFCFLAAFLVIAFAEVGPWRAFVWSLRWRATNHDCCFCHA